MLLAFVASRLWVCLSLCVCGSDIEFFANGKIEIIPVYLYENDVVFSLLSS